jgi:hypothetical protein
LVTSLLLLAAGAPSLLVDRTFRLDAGLEEMPAALSIGAILENIAPAAIVSIEESAGFSDPDPMKLSIYGSSWMWNAWYLDGFDITDPLFSGSLAFSIPFRLLGSVGIVHSANPSTRMRQGVTLELDHDVRFVAGGTYLFPRAGGRFPGLGPGIVNGISGTHASERTPPPPEERRRFGEDVQVHAAGASSSALGELAYGLQVERGSRRFLDFRPDGALDHVFDEPFAIASIAAVLVPSGTDHRITLLGEARVRERAFAELGHAERETHRMSSGGILIGAAVDRLRAALTIKTYELEPVVPGFTRELFDADGQALFPFHPSGRTTAARIELSYEGEDFYFAANNRFLAFTPGSPIEIHPVVAGGRPYGTWTLRSAPTTRFLGDDRLGLAGDVGFGLGKLAYDVYLAAMYAANRSGANGLGFVDLGLKAAVELDGPVRPMLALAKTPIPPSGELAELLDPLHQDGELRLSDGRLVDTIGGGHASLAPFLSATNVYSASTGIEVPIGAHFRFEAMGLVELYDATPRLELTGGGGFAGGAFYLSEGEKAYVLEDRSRHRPLYYGGHLGLFGIDPERYVVLVAFSAYAAIGRSAFGNGPLANDPGATDFLSANPNADVNALANLDGDRAFHLKILLGCRVIDGLWAFLSFRHRDGQPFAFIDAKEHDGQIALQYASTRGAPRDLSRPLSGPREDFQVNVDVQVTYTFGLGDLGARVGILGSNLLDLENELQERNGPLRPVGRPALETQIPRSLTVLFELLAL